MTQLIRRPGYGAACFAVSACLLGFAGGAQAQWAWRDASGNITYSDTPPPSDVRPANILQQPAPLAAADLRRSSSGADRGSSPGSSGAGEGAPPPANAPAAALPPASPARSLAEQDAEFRKRQAEREKAAQKAEQDEAQANSRAAACTQAKGYLELIESGARLLRPDADGNRNFMDEEQRAAEMQKAQDGIARNCS